MHIWERLSIGSDESGKGDFFGGPVAVAVRLDQETLDRIKGWEEYSRIQDSKKCSDDWIRMHAEELMGMCRYEAIELSPEKYNKAYEKYRNMNSLLAHLHNAVHSRLKGNEPRIIDAFVNEEHYRRYLKNENTDYVKIDCMEHKADSKYLSVAIASIVSRYLYMKQMDRLKEESGVQIPYGNSYVSTDSVYSVIDAYRKLLNLKKYSVEELNRKFVKMNFSTLSKIKDALGC